MTQEMMYDPPAGWRYGFPLPYRPLPGGTLRETLIRDGYPEEMATAKHCRFWESEVDDTAARLAVGGVGSGYGTPTHANDNVPVAAQPARKGDWLQTYTGRKFRPLDARPEDVDIRDIAHALSMLCRYGGHSLRFYSVAEHSVHIARWLDRQNYKPEVALAGLLHDATEAYLTDVPRPLKRHLAGYKKAEAALWTVIAEGFGLTGYENDLPMAVHEADNRILGDEVARLMVPMEWHAKHDDPIGAEIECWSPQRAEAEFLRAFYHCERLREMANG